MDSEQIVHDVAERVRAIVAEAEERATQIVREAEEEATRIRAKAETEGRKRLEEMREALDALEGKLGASEPPGPTAPSEPGPATANGDAKPDHTAGARLVAMNMALDGAARDQILAKLSKDFELDDVDALVDEVLALATK